VVYSEYVGQWVSDKQDGEGVLTDHACGDRFQGQFKEGCRSGQGTLNYGDGGVYEGSWEADGRHGEGRLVTGMGDTFVGQFKNGSPHGKGVETYAGEGQGEFTGVWQMGHRHG
jgi:hypothetical protein